MSDPAVPQGFTDRMDDIERRLRDAERSPKLPYSSIRGGTLRVFKAGGEEVVSIGQNGSLTCAEFYDDTGLLVTRIGELPSGASGLEAYDGNGDLVARFGQVDSGARNGFEVYNGAGIRILRADERGALEPNIYVPFSTLQDISVTSGTFTTVYHGRIPVMKNPYLHLEVDVDCDGGTTASLRLTISRSPGGTQTSTIKSVPSGALATYHLYIEVNMVLDGRALFLLEARRDSGGGAIRVTEPFADLGDYSATATTSGVWV